MSAKQCLIQSRSEINSLLWFVFCSQIPLRMKFFHEFALSGSGRRLCMLEMEKGVGTPL